MRSGLIVVLLGLACSCQVEKRPQSWSQAPASAGPNASLSIAGDYSNAGKDAKGEEVKLAVWLTLGIDQTLDGNAKHQYYKDLRDASVVKIEIKDDRITISANGDNINKNWSYFKVLNQFDYNSNKGIWKIQSPLNGNAVNMVGHASAFIELKRIGNDLMVHRNSNWVGVVLLVPGWEHQS